MVIGALLGPSGGAGASPTALSALAISLSRSDHETFEATYRYTVKETTRTVTIARAPGEFYLSSGGTTVVTRNGATETCNAVPGSAPACSKVANVPSAIFLGGYFDTTTTVAELKLIQAEASAGLGHVRVTSFSATYAKQRSRCATIRSKGPLTTFCVATGKGVLSHMSEAGTDATVITLKRFTSSPPTSLFRLPAATTTTSTSSTTSASTTTTTLTS
jgi:hypothetical protein